MARVNVLVTEAEYGKGREVFESISSDVLEFKCAPANETALAAFIRRSSAFGVVLGVDRYEGALYESLPPGGIIARFGVGHDGVDKAKARAKDLHVTNTPGALDVSVAESAMCLIGALARNTVDHAQESRDGCWLPRQGIELKGKTLSLIGFGRIAREVAGIAAKGFGMKIMACDTNVTDAQIQFAARLVDETGLAIRLIQSLDEALSVGDFTSVHLPLNDTTKGLIGSGEMSLMPKGSYLINSARGGIVDEIALYNALSSGHLAGAGIDVFEYEPYQPVRPDKDLRTLRNCVMTPHISSNTDQSNRRMAEMCVANVQALIEGRHSDMTSV